MYSCIPNSLNTKQKQKPKQKQKQKKLFFEK